MIQSIHLIPIAPLLHALTHLCVCALSSTECHHVGRLCGHHHSPDTDHFHRKDALSYPLRTTATSLPFVVVFSETKTWARFGPG